MAVSILEALQNAKYNLETVIQTGMTQLLPMAIDQLTNGVELLDKGYPIDQEVEPLLQKYGSIEAVPEYQEE